MRAGSLRFARVVGVVLLWPVARCGGVIEGASDGSVEGGGGGGGGACSKAADCPTGYGCYYAASDGCSAVGQCRPTFACKGGIACACDGTSTSECGGYATAPVAHPGLCKPEGPCGSGLACELCDVSGYLPNPMQPPATTLNACSPSEISAFVTACIDTNATQQSCNAWQNAEVDAGTCLACVFSLQSGTSWSALVCDSTSCDINTAGCVDLVTGTVSEEKQSGGPGSCGDLLSAASGCESYACNTCDTSGGTGSDFNTCTNQATANECASFNAQVNSTTGACAIDGSGAPECFPHAPADFPALLNVFCGTGP